jgi:hypothetical protein
MAKRIHGSIAVGFALLAAACAARETSVPASAESAQVKAEQTSSATAKPSVERVGDVDGPLAAFERFLAAVAGDTLNSDEGRALVGGEFEKDPYERDEQALGPCDAIVRIDEGHAVARVTVHDPGGKSFKLDEKEEFEFHTPALDTNLYFYLENSDTWRVTGVRALAQTWLDELLIALDDAFPLQDPEQRENVAQARLTLQSDQQLVQWFAEHRADLDALASRTIELARGEAKYFKKDGELAEALTALHIHGAELQSDHTVRIVIGGITDNIVGFLLVPEGVALPHITPNDVIWAQSLGGGWFLFRTT